MEGISFPTLALARAYTDEHGGGGGGGSKAKTLTISLGTSWTGDDPYRQAVSVSGYSVTSKTKVDLVADSATVDSMLSMGVAQIYVENNNGTLTVVALGGMPTKALTLQAIFSEVN